MGLLVVILLFVVLWALVEISRVKKSTAEQIAMLTHRIWSLEQRTEVPAARPVVQPTPQMAPVTAPIHHEVPPPIPPIPPLPPIPQAAPLPQPLPPPPPRKPRSSQEWESLIGGNLLNKIGALLLVIGIISFLAYYGTRMGPAGRAGCSVLVSLTLLASGVMLERNETYRLIARSLIGAGWAALYATSYAIYALPAARIIESPFIGSCLMLLVAAGMIAHSLRYRAQGVTAVAFFSAFAALAVTPSTPFAVVSLIPLAAAVLYLAQRFNWYQMALMGIFATYGACAWRGSSGAPLIESETLFLVYWVLFEVFDIMRFARRVSGWAVELIFPLNAVGFLGLSYFSWTDKSPDTLWQLSSIAALLYLVSTLWRLKIEFDRTFDQTEDLATRIRSGSYESPLTLCAVMAAAAIVQKLTGLWMTTALALEAQALFTLGVRFRLNFLRVLATIGFAGTVLHLLTVDTRVPHTWVYIALFHVLLFYVNRAMSEAKSTLAEIYSWAGSLLLAVALAEELPNRLIGTGWMVLGIILLEFGIQKKLVEFRWQAYLIAFGGALHGLLFFRDGTSHALPYFVDAAVACTMSVRLTMSPEQRDIARNVFSGLGLLLACVALWIVVPHQFAPAAWAAIGLAALLAGNALDVAPYRLQAHATALFAALTAFVLTLPDGTHNRLMAIALLIAIHIAFRFLSTSRAGIEVQAPLAHEAASALLAAALIYQEVSGRMLTIAWGAEALTLLTIGFALRDRPLRLQGLALFLICVLKLFLYDLRNLDTPYRIVSFIALGLILLGVSWIYTRFREQLQKLL